MKRCPTSLVLQFISFQSLSYLTLCKPMNCIMPGFPVHHHLHSCPLSWWCHPTILPSVVCPLLLLPWIFPSIRVFSNESVLHIRWSKYWSFSFSISPCNEYSGLISFRIDWFDLLAVQGTLKSLLQHHKSIHSSALSFLYSPTLTTIHDPWKNHSRD